jgi:hypothetical protein
MNPLSEPDKLAISGLVQVAKWISFLIMTATGLAATVCVLRITKQVEFTVSQVKLKLSAFPYVVAVVTLSHLFLTWGFVQEVSSVRSLGSDAAVFAWRSLTESDAFVFNGMWPRVWRSSSSHWFHGFYLARSADRAFWATAIFAVLTEFGIALSLTPLREKVFAARLRTLRVFSLGSALALLNWIIGTHWAIAASSLFH